MLLPYAIAIIVAYSTVTMKLLRVFVCMLYFFRSFILFFLLGGQLVGRQPFLAACHMLFILILFVMQL